MTASKKKRILERIVALESDIAKLKEVRIQILSTGYASATLASSGGSKSYTRMDASKITEAIGELQKELKAMRSILRAETAAQITTIATIYS